MEWWKDGILGTKKREVMMSDTNPKEQKPDPERLAALRKIPKHVMENLTKDEVRAFLHDEVWPDSLQEKLKDYLRE